jgi:hypothetical protein
VFTGSVNLLRRQFEWSAADCFPNGAAANALGTDFHGFGCPVVLGDSHSLQIRPELPARDPRDFGTDTTQVLGLTTGLNGVAHLSTFSTNFAGSCHADDHI